MAESQMIASLVPLNQDLKEDSSVSKIPVFRGPNSIGRSSLSLSLAVADKRLSRNRLTLTASPDGSATLTVEGTNPVVVSSGNDRKKLYSREEGTISNGDIIELIPGHYLFKYVISDTVNSKAGEANSSIRKRSRQTSEVNVSAKNSKNSGDSNEEAIRHFHVSDDKLALTFRLLRVQGLPQWANTSCVSIGDVIQGDILFAVLSNYMVDVDWLVATCPLLSKIPQVLVVHGEGDGTLDHMKRSKPANWVLHKPPLPISFGTHHSKAMLLVYPRGVRVIIHTATLIYVDWNNKTQGVWMQDFPWKERNHPRKGCAFENDLTDYLSALKLPELSVNFPNFGSFTINSSLFKKFDYSSAEVRLIASVPGYHTGGNLKKWGHMKLRTVLLIKSFKNLLLFISSPP